MVLRNVLGNVTVITTIANEEGVYKWNVGVRFEGDEERNLKMVKKIFQKSWHQLKDCSTVEFTGIKIGFFILAMVLIHQNFY